MGASRSSFLASGALGQWHRAGQRRGGRRGGGLARGLGVGAVAGGQGRGPCRRRRSDRRGVRDGGPRGSRRGSRTHQPHPRGGVERTPERHVVERDHQHLEGGRLGRRDFAGQGLEPPVGLAGEDGAEGDVRLAIGERDAAFERQDLHGAGDVPWPAERAELGVEGAQLDVVQDAAGPEPAARDGLCAEPLDQRLGQHLSRGRAEQQVAARRARVDRPAHAPAFSTSACVSVFRDTRR